MPPELPRTRKELAAHLAGRLDDHEPDHRDAPRGVSGVLVPLREGTHGPELVLTRRAEDLSSHPGEVSFPGGRLEGPDAGPRAAALRETQEEIGLAPGHLEVVGHLTDYQPFHGPLICAYVGVLRPTAPEPHRASPREVAEVLSVDLASLLDPNTSQGATGSNGVWRAASYESRVWDDEEEGDRQVHYWHLSRDTAIWGITGELLARFLREAFSWEPPTAPRRIHSLEEFWA